METEKKKGSARGWETCMHSTGAPSWDLSGIGVEPAGGGGTACHLQEIDF